MKITEDVLMHVASLSRIQIGDGERQAMAAAMDEVVGYIDTLSQLDTDDVSPHTRAGACENALRADVAGTPLSVQDILQNAPGRTEDCFTVPRVLV